MPFLKLSFLYSNNYSQYWELHFIFKEFPWFTFVDISDYGSTFVGVKYQEPFPVDHGGDCPQAKLNLAVFPLVLRDLLCCKVAHSWLGVRLYRK